MKEDLIVGLNPDQKEAVLYLDSPLLIIAGAGSGKTRVISHKIAYLIAEKGYAPGDILGVTFTNKAAKEMKERIAALTGIQAAKFNISTFHSLGLRILREAGTPAGFDAEWQVLDEHDQKKTVSRIIKENFAHFTNDMAEEVRRKINSAKMYLDYPNNPDYLIQRGFSGDEVKVYSLYYDYQKQNKLWDYEDLVSLPVILMQTYPEVRKKYASRYKYVMVDEFQDTNPNQYDLIREIAGKHKQITVVGDDDQAIYAWRGASIQFLLNFEHDFPPTHSIKLQQNYRSTQQVLDFANNIISHNMYRRKKSMWTEKKEGKPVFILRTQSKEEEAEEIARLIMQLKDKKAASCFPLAILYRINSQSLAFETEFLKQGIDFQILKGQPFFARKEVKDSLALLKLAINIKDDTSFLRMAEFLPLGIGGKTLETLNDHAKKKNTSLFQALQKYLPEKFASQKIFEKIFEVHQMGKAMPLSDMLDALIKASGYNRILENKKEDSRLLNIAELKEFLKKWENDNPGKDFNALLDKITLDAGGKDDAKKSNVYLLTMHNAKGLEFPTVVAAGINATYMPFFLRKSSEEIEEERRLFYVASTRAIEHLVISTGSPKQSIFLSTILSPFYTAAYSSTSIVEQLTPQTGRSVFPGPGSVRSRGAAARPEAVEEKFVRHPVFGRGKIINALGANRYVVHFVDKGEKTIDASIVPLEFL